MAISYGTYTIAEVQEGSQIWTTIVAPVSPDYTFAISNLTGDSDASVKIGDIIMYSYYRYTVLSISSDGTTVLTGNRVSIRGATGAASVTYTLIVSNLAIIKDKNGNISPTTITLTAKSQTGSSAMANYAGRFKIETTINNSTWITQYTSSANEATKNWTVIDDIIAVRCSLYLKDGTTTLLDQQTIPIVSDGIDGTDGNDAYSIILTNENHTFAGNTTSALASEIECNVIAYKGITQVASTIGTITGQPTGMTTEILNNGKTNASFKVKVTTSMTTKNGVLNIPITVDGKSFAKKFTYTLTLDGEKGDKGDTAQWYYGELLTHTSGTATLPISQTEDVAVGAMYLNIKTGACYKCTAISGSNATWTYAGNITDGISIGGRNLLKDSNTSTYISKNSAIAHLKNGADNVPLQSFVVNIDPIQDLHGYDSPWPAGGGKNLFNPYVYTGIAYNPMVGDTVTLTDSATQFTDNGNGVFTVTTSSTWRYFNIIIPIDPTKEYATKIVFNSTGQAGVTRGYLDADFKILTKFNSTDSAISWEYSLTPEANAAYYYFVFTNRGTASATLTLTQPQFVEGATVGDYAPYENICPISGWNGVKVTRCGKNLWNPVSSYPATGNGITYSLNADGSIHVQGTASGQSNNYPIASNGMSVYAGTYTMSVKTTDPNIHFIFGGGNGTSGVAYTDMVNGSVKTFTTAGGTTGHNIIRVNSGATVNGDIYIQLEEGSTATPYEPYNGDVYEVSLASAGTVYGGTLNVLTGVLTVDRLGVPMESLTWYRSTSYANPIFYTTITGKASDYRKLACSILRNIGSSTIIAAKGFATQSANGDFASSDANAQIYARYDSATTVQEFVTAVTGQTIVYPLATPYEIQLTPHQIRTLYGQNNIWADTGNVTINYKTNELIGNASQIIPSSTTITISIQVDANDIIWDTSATHKRIGVSLSLSKDGGGTQYIEAWVSSSDENCTGIVERFNTSFHGRIKYTYTLLGDIVLNRPANLYIQGISSGTVSVSRPKLEIGNKATDWTPAPEDVDADIEDARKVATNYLSVDSTGIMIADLNDGEQTPSEATGNNVFIDNTSVNIRDGQTTLASFGIDGMQIGLSDESHTTQDYHSWKMIDKEGNTYVHISDLRDTTGWAIFEESYVPIINYDGSPPCDHAIELAFPINSNSDIISAEINGTSVESWEMLGNVRPTEYIQLTPLPSDNDNVTIKYKSSNSALKAYTFGTRQDGSVLGGFSFAEGYNTVARGRYSHSEGYQCKAIGYNSHAEGYNTTAKGRSSHAENSGDAYGDYSHAEGNAITYGHHSHAEGASHASGEYSHSEGYQTGADGNYSHAQNFGTQAKSEAQTAIGKFNIEDTNNTYALIVGNGTDVYHKSNALTVDWNGTIETADGFTTSTNVTKLDNCDDGTDPRKYYYLDSSGTNKPSTAWIYLRCFAKSGQNVIQIATSMGALTSKMWMRSRDANGVWGDWELIPTISAAPYKWKSASYTASNLASGYTDVTTNVSFPTLTGYARTIMVVGTNSAYTGATGAYIDSNNKVHIRCRNFASSASSPTISFIMIYLNESYTWT